MKDIVFVEGNLIFKSGNHQVKELVAYANDKWRQIAEDIHEGDLIVSKDDILASYKIYCAASEVASYGNFISGMQRPQNVINIYRQEIENLKKLQTQTIDDELINVLYRQIYIGVVGSMELFLCDFLYSMVLGTRKYYKRFCEQASRPFQLKEVSSKQWSVQEAVKRTILETNYHRINDVRNLYNRVIEIDIPKSKRLEELIMTRHSLVHRNGIPSDKSEYINVNDAMISELFFEVEILISTIINNKRAEIEDWFPRIN
jgi:hypothetical protein